LGDRWSGDPHRPPTRRPAHHGLVRPVARARYRSAECRMSAQLESLRRQSTPRPRRARRVEDGGPLVFGSGKGGAGTSTLAGLLAVGASASGSRVLLVDGNAGFGSLHLLMGVD